MFVVACHNDANNHVGMEFECVFHKKLRF